MKTKIILSTLLLIFTSSAFAMEIDERDKQYHMGASYALQASTSLVYKHHYKMSSWEAGFYGALTTLAIGAAKEYAFDKQADTQDLQADAMGVGIAFPVVFFDF